MSTLEQLVTSVIIDTNDTSNDMAISQQDEQQMDSSQHGDSQQQASNTIGAMQLDTILKNKEILDNVRVSLKDAIKYLTLDPYAPASNNKSQDVMDMQPDNQMTMDNMQPDNQMTMDDMQPGSNINNNNEPETQKITMAIDSSMQNMGAVYDTSKMEELHSGLFDLAVGMAIIDQLSNEFIDQAESVNLNTQNPIQYYRNQYNLTIQNKSSLNQAMNYIEKSADLVNINPYIASNGIVYDKERMEQIHQSVFKLAESVATINQLNNDLNSQSIYLSNAVQIYTNHAISTNATNITGNSDLNNHTNSNLTNSTNSQSSQTTMTTGSNSINLANVVNGILITFVIGLILGIIGFIMSLFKAPKALDVTAQQPYNEAR